MQGQYQKKHKTGRGANLPPDPLPKSLLPIGYHCPPTGRHLNAKTQIADNDFSHYSVGEPHGEINNNQMKKIRDKVTDDYSE